MKKELVLKFQYDGIVYIVYKENNDYIAGKISKNQIITKLNKKELDLVNSVFNGVTFNNSKKYSTILYLGAEVDVFKDENNNLYNFKYHNGTNVTKTDLYTLNKIFNNQSLEVEFALSNDNKYYKRIVKYGKKLIVVFMSATMVLESGCALKNNNVEVHDVNEKTGLEDIVLPKMKEQPILGSDEIVIIDDKSKDEVATSETSEVIQSNENSNSTETTSEDSDFIEENDLEEETLEEPIDVVEDITHYENLSNEEKINTLRAIISENTKLTDEEKKFILDNFDIINDNVDLLDFDQVAYTYKNLHIEYYQERFESGAVGRFYSDSSTIQIAQSTCLEDANKITLLHELSHTLENSNKDFSNKYLFEGLNAIFTSEYFGEKYGDNNTLSDTSYPEARNYLYVLVEVLGPDVLREFHFKQDINILYNEMFKYLGNIEDCNNIPAYIQILSENKIMDEYTTSIKDNIFSILANMYLNKYNEPIYNNLEIMARLNPGFVAGYINYSDDYDEIDRTLIVKTQKAYFNKNNNMYMVPSTYSLRRTIHNYKSIYSLEEGINMGSVRLENGEYIAANSTIVIDGDIVYETIPMYEMNIDVDLQEDFLRENVKVK